MLEVNNFLMVDVTYIHMSVQPSGPKQLPLIGNTHQFVRDPLQFMTKCRREYGDVARFQLGPYDSYLIMEASEIERILVSESEKYKKPQYIQSLYDILGEGLLLGNGQVWEEQRKRAKPSFKMDRLRNNTDVILKYVERRLEEWHDGKVIDVEQEMTEITTRSIIEILFGVEMSDAGIQTVQDNLDPISQQLTPDLMTYLAPEWIQTPSDKKFEASLERIFDVLDDAIYERRRQGIDEDDMDFLAVMIRAKESGALSEELLRSELMTLLLAGNGSTALALTYSWYLLSQNPDAKARFHDELATVCDDEQPTMNTIRELEYTGRVHTEAMRLYPPGYVILREPTEDVTISGYTIPSDGLLFLPEWTVHRDPRYYDSPKAFDPDRWTAERSSNRPTYAYFPFGGGKRICTGQHLAKLVGQIVLAAIGQQYHLRLAPTSEGPLSFTATTTLDLKEPIHMIACER